MRDELTITLRQQKTVCFILYYDYQKIDNIHYDELHTSFDLDMRIKKISFRVAIFRNENQFIDFYMIMILY